jgi:hypothetical protein
VQLSHFGDLADGQRRHTDDLALDDRWPFVSTATVVTVCVVGGAVDVVALVTGGGGGRGTEIELVADPIRPDSSSSSAPFSDTIFIQRSSVSDVPS